MSKGLKVTLMMVAIALIGYHAMATAPVIGDIPSPIVADDAPVTGGNNFVYPDAINLDTYVSDDGGLAGVTWSYLESTGTYQLNGVASLTAGEVAGGTPANPGAKAISTQVLQSETNTDNNAKTVTFRNVKATPFSGSPTVTYTTIGIADSKVVTLYASDGSTFTAKNIMVYSDKVGTNVDRLSPEGYAKEETSANLNFATGTNNWSYGAESYSQSATSGTTGGVCITVAAAGVNVASWASQYPAITIAAGSGWRVRVSITSNQTTAYLNPLWDIIYDNIGNKAGGGTGGSNAFGGDYMFLDNEGGANAPGTLGRGTNGFQVWVTPLPVQTPQWATNGLSTTNDPNNDIRLIFRVLDVPNAGYQGENDTAQLCVTNLVIDRYLLSKMQEAGVAYNAASIQKATSADSTKFTIAGLVNTPEPTYNQDGSVTILPGSGGWTNELVKVEPGDATANPSTGAGLADNWMIPWTANKLYKMEVKMSAPDATGETNPPDVIRFGMDSPTTEMIGLSMITPNMERAGSPKFAAAQTYTTFFYSHSVSLTSIPNAKTLRPRMDIIVSDQLSANGLTANNGGLKVHSMKVTEMKLPMD